VCVEREREERGRERERERERGNSSYYEILRVHFGHILEVGRIKKK